MTIFLESLGIGLVIPIMPDLIRRFSSDPDFIAQYYGYFISAYALMQFLASPFLGSLSDRFGRRPILLVSLLGAGIDYLIMAYAPDLTVLFLGRIVSGLTGASFTVAAAYMADISDDSNRSVNFGMIGAAFGLGFIVGPVLGGFLGTVGPHACFIAAAGLNLANFCFGYFILPESLLKTSRRPIDWRKMNPFKSLSKMVRRSSMLGLIWVYTLTFLASQVHTANWTLYTQTKFGWSLIQVGLSLSFVGFAIAVVQGGLTRYLIPWFGESKAVLYGSLINIFTLALFGFASQGWMMYAIMSISALAGITNPALQSLITKHVPATEQGELQGTLVSLGSLTAIIGPVFFTDVFAIFTKPGAPIYFPGASYLAASAIALIATLVYLKVPADFSPRGAPTISD